MIKRILKYMSEHKLIYFISVIFLIVEYGLAVVPTKIIQRVVDLMSAKTLTADSRTLLLGIFLLVAIFGYIGAYIWQSRLFWSYCRLKCEVRTSMFDKIISMKKPFYEKFRSGDMLTRFTNDINDFSDLIGYGFMSILFVFTTLIFVIPSMFFISVKISVLSAIPMIITGFIITVITKKFDNLIDERRTAVSNLGNEVLEVVEGIRVTRAYGKKDLAQKKFREKTKLLTKKSDHVTLYQAFFGKIVGLSMGLGTVILISLGTVEIKNGTLTLGGVIAIQLYMVMLIEPMWMISDLFVVYKTGKVAYGKIEELLKTSDDIEKVGTIGLNEIENIEFKDYSFKYANSESYSLKNINLKINKGETLGIVGKTGSGKTTFVRQFLRQYKVGEGSFLVNEKDIFDYDIKSVEEKLGYVPQEHILFSKSVKENIAMGKENATDKEIDKAIETAYFTEDLKNMERKIHTLIGEKGASISGGQKQRISIARAFVKDPELLILDDSLSAVDAKTERKIIENIQEIRKGKTNLIITHRLSAINHADFVIVFDNGEIIERGTPKELIDKKGWYFEQYQRQQLEGGENEDDN